MITIISSAKTMDITPINKHKIYSPYFLRETKVLLNECKAFDQEKLMSLMDINKKLAELTYQRFQEYDNTIAKPALFAYDGDVFKQLNKLEYSIDNLDFIQDHLCIISGLYGLLKPLDLIVPYRLEMAVNLHTDKIKSLYNFWSAKATKYLNDLLAEHKVKYLINLASAEYSKIIDLTI